MLGAGCPRVTHPFATQYNPEGLYLVRLACVKHAASVHPEPGSNSPLKESQDLHPEFHEAFGSLVIRGRLACLRYGVARVVRVDSTLKGVIRFGLLTGPLE